MTHRMDMLTDFNDDDVIPAFRDGCQRLVKRSTVLGAIEQRLSTVEQAPSNAGLASRVGSLEQWRQNKAPAISDASTDMSGMGVNVAGVNVASTSAVQSKLSEHAGKINDILGSLRQREVIDA